MELVDWISPLKTIASELRLLRHLYELDLASRNPPVYRLTQRPKKTDTEVLYPDVEDERPKHKRGFEVDDDDEN